MKNIKMLSVSLALLINAFSLNALADLEAGYTAINMKNFDVALSEFRPEAEKGNARAQAILGMMYETGSGVERNYTQAIQWYRKSAEQGFAVAQVSMGKVYQEGKGVPKDYSQAVQWYRKGAEQGYSEAQFLLGFMYHQGRGVQQDYPQAVQWYRKSAEQGWARAQEGLGFLYYYGFGVPKDLVVAYGLFLVSAAGDDMSSDGDQMLKIIIRAMTPAQLEKGTTLFTQMMDKKLGLTKALDRYLAENGK